jgi:hypothetical protein
MNALSLQAFSGPQSEAAVAVIDLDNTLHRGLDARGMARPYAVLDVQALVVSLRAAGVTTGTVCQHRQFQPLAEQLWRQLGFTPLATHRNCDPDVICEVDRYVEIAGARRVVLVAGDGDYCKLVRRLSARGVEVEVWGRSRITSQKLQALACRVCPVDRFVWAPAMAA